MWKFWNPWKDIRVKLPLYLVQKFRLKNVKQLWKLKFLVFRKSKLLNIFEFFEIFSFNKVIMTLYKIGLKGKKKGKKQDLRNQNLHSGIDFIVEFWGFLIFKCDIDQNFPKVCKEVAKLWASKIWGWLPWPWDLITGLLFLYVKPTTPGRRHCELWFLFLHI